MIRKIVVWLLLGIPPLLLLRWDDRHGHHTPNWLFMLSAAPLFIAAWLNDDDGEHPGPVANFLLFVLGLFAIGMGAVGYVLLDPSFIWGAPMGVVMMLVAVFRGWRD